MSRIRRLLFLFVLAAQVPLASATVTYVVGSCKPNPQGFTSIQSALNATPQPNVVEVCPGTYNEQILIIIPVTLQGISAPVGATGPSAPIIAVPSGGLSYITNNDLGQPMYPQVTVFDSGGEVNLSNLIVDGYNNGVTGNNEYIAGVLYINSPGTINYVYALNQNGNGFGSGVWLQGGSADPVVTVENSDVAAYDYAGVYAETNSSTSELTATISGNNVAGLVGSTGNGIQLVSGLTASVSGNSISEGGVGIEIQGGSSTISGNKITSPLYGITVGTDHASVTSNLISNSVVGIRANSAVAPVTGNTITQAGSAAINFNCTGGKNVHSNTIVGAFTGLESVPTATVTTNSFRDVEILRSGGC